MMITRYFNFITAAVHGDYFKAFAYSYVYMAICYPFFANSGAGLADAVGFIRSFFDALATLVILFLVSFWCHKMLNIAVDYFDIHCSNFEKFLQSDQNFILIYVGSLALYSIVFIFNDIFYYVDIFEIFNLMIHGFFMYWIMIYLAVNARGEVKTLPA